MKNKIHINFPIVLFIMLISIILVFISQDFCFFYDNTSQISVPAHWFYSNNFSNLFIPADIATGHPPLMALYIALVWKIFGYSLLSAHWAMLPFIFGFFWQLYVFARIITDKIFSIVAILLIVATDACILSQCTLITFEIPHIFFFLMALNAIIKQKRFLLTLSIAFISLISLRGTLSCFGLFLFDIVYNRVILNKWALKRSLYYIPGLALVFAYLLTRYLLSGWAVHNTTSNAWETSAQFATPSIIIKNIIVLALRIFEYGRIYILFALLLILFWYKHLKNDRNFTTIALALITQAIVFFPLVIIYQNPFSTRYFMPFLILLNAMAIYFLLNYIKQKKALILVIFINIGGYVIIYPQHIAMPWDCTPAHWSFYNLREDMLQYIEKQNIDPDSVAGGHSFYGIQKFKDLKRNYSISQEPTKKYYIHSNIANPTDTIISLLSNNKNWELVKRIEKHRVFIELYKNKNL